MHIASVGTAFPAHRYSQQEIASALCERWKDKLPEPRLLARLHANCGVAYRNLVLPLEEYPNLKDFGMSNDAWIKGAVDCGRRAVECSLLKANCGADDISAIFFATVTGIASPTIDARLINLLPFPTHIKRTPIFGLGCVAGAAGIARATDYLAGHPKENVLLLSVELCSLTWQDDDQSLANLISTGLFADGAAAVVMRGTDSGTTKGPRVLATRSSFYRHTERVMGWDVISTGFRIVLSPDVPRVVQDNLRRDVDGFLAEQGLALSDISSVICHSGGPKVLEAVERALDLPAEALEPSWRSLREVGNLSAASVLVVLQEYIEQRPGKPGSYSLLLAMGPAFCAELVLLQW
jgi:alkylresorcinol/alkylpyrone synthase